MSDQPTAEPKVDDQVSTQTDQSDQVERVEQTQEEGQEVEDERVYESEFLLVPFCVWWQGFGSRIADYISQTRADDEIGIVKLTNTPLLPLVHFRSPPLTFDLRFKSQTNNHPSSLAYLPSNAA